MPLTEHVYSVLLVSSFVKFNESLCAMLPASGYNPVLVAGSIGEAQRCLTDRAFDMVIINTPLNDDFGRKTAIDISLDRRTVVMLLVRNELYDEIYADVKNYGVLTMRKPVTAQSLLQAFDWMCAMRERLRGLEIKAVSLEDKMAEIRIVNRAKWALIESLKMTESDAHRYIEKQAMDRCVTRREIAEGILQTYKGK